MEGTEPEEVSAVGSGCQAQVCIGNDVPTVDAKEFLGRHVSELVELKTRIGLPDGYLGARNLAVSRYRIDSLGDRRFLACHAIG